MGDEDEQQIGDSVEEEVTIAEEEISGKEEDPGEGRHQSEVGNPNKTFEERRQSHSKVEVHYDQRARESQRA